MYALNDTKLSNQNFKTMFEIVCFSFMAAFFLISGKLAIAGLSSNNDRLKMIGIGSLCSSILLAVFAAVVTN